MAMIQPHTDPDENAFLKSRTLNWVNEQREKKLGKGPLQNLPLGVRGDPNNCVLARCWQCDEEANIKAMYDRGERPWHDFQA